MHANTSGSVPGVVGHAADVGDERRAGLRLVAVHAPRGLYWNDARLARAVAAVDHAGDRAVSQRPCRTTRRRCGHWVCPLRRFSSAFMSTGKFRGRFGCDIAIDAESSIRNRRSTSRLGLTRETLREGRLRRADRRLQRARRAAPSAAGITDASTIHPSTRNDERPDLMIDLLSGKHSNEQTKMSLARRGHFRLGGADHVPAHPRVPWLATDSRARARSRRRRTARRRRWRPGWWRAGRSDRR